MAAGFRSGGVVPVGALQRAGQSVQSVRTRTGPPSTPIQGQLWPAGQRAFSFHSTCMALNYIRCNGRRVAIGRGTSETFGEDGRTGLTKWGAVGPPRPVASVSGAHPA